MIEQSIDRDTNRLNNTGICLQITSKNLEAHNQLTSELKKACSYLEKSRSANHKNIEPTQKKPAPSKPNKQWQVKKQEAKEIAEYLNYSQEEYELQAAIVREISNQAQQYKKPLKNMSYFSYIALIFAVALRLAKVTGEIALKKNPIPKNEKQHTT